MSYSQTFSQAVKKGVGYMQIAKNVTSKDYISSAPRKNLYRSSNHPSQRVGGVTESIEIDLSGQGNPLTKNNNSHAGPGEVNSSSLDKHGILSPLCLHPTTIGAYNRTVSLQATQRIQEKILRKHLFNYQREKAPAKAMRTCQRVPIEIISNKTNKEEETVVTIEINKSGYKIKGMATCNNPNCISCANYRKSERAERVELGIYELQLQGYTPYFVTLTQPRSNNLVKQLENTKLGIRNIQRKLDRKKLEYESVIAKDITFSNAQNKGTYHMHIHAIFMIKSDYSDNAIDTFISDAWRGSVKTAQMQCQKVERVKCKTKLSRYVAKMSGLAMEIGSQITKRSWASMSLIQLMINAMDGDYFCEKTYQEFLAIMKGKKTLSFSRNWPKFEEDSIKIEEDKITLEVPAIWHIAAKDYYDDIGILCWLGELQGINEFDSNLNHPGRAFYHNIKHLFEQNTEQKLKDTYGEFKTNVISVDFGNSLRIEYCLYKEMKANLVDLIQEAYEEFAEIEEYWESRQ